ncbi:MULTISPECIES: pilus assembly protein PilC [Acinetobacter]|uniref:pilus assembly protein PilC n=1 Tax=Acinetobacter TaxID=469 RepID=UPI00257E80DE|nr:MULTISPECIES: pilus assembly protein PilC [Acinetobacter]
MDKINHKNTLSATVSMLMTLTVCSSVSQASDIDIYSNATSGKTTITLMLDTSGSMSESQVGGSACELASGTTYTAGNEPSGTTPGYTKYFCGVDIPGSSSQRVYYYKRTGGSWNRTWFSCGASGSPNVDACTIPINDPDPNNSFEDTGSNPRYYYKNERPQIKHYDRLTRLKDAIFTLMDSNQIDSNSVAMGIGQFSSQSGNDNVYTNADGSSGKILVPAALLTSTQRTAIKTAVANLVGSNGTPTANAYAEVAAYMLGTNTTTNITGLREEYVSSGTDIWGRTVFSKCVGWSGFSCNSFNGNQGTITGSNGWSTQQCALNWSPSRTCLVQSNTSTASNLGYSGFSKSVLGSKVGSSSTATNYQTPLSTTNTQCNGQGIYFLTDGEPNSSPVPVPLMQAALGANGSSFSVPATGTLPNGTQAGHGMPAVGEFAKALRNQRASTTAPNRNPLGLEIKTAVVGFGSVFNVDRTADAARPVAQRVIRTLDYINSQGVRTNEQRDYYNCSLITNVDAQNACNWGAKPHPDLPGVGGYGNGGFYSAQSTQDVVQSVVKFLDDVKPEFDPVATGSPTLPQDALNPLRIQPYGYYASFIPKPQEAFRLWAGNLNKYHIHNGELYDTGKTIRLIKADGSMDSRANGIWVGGVKANLPLGIKLNIENEPFASRTIYTNRQITGTTAPYTASEANSLKKVNLSTLFGSGSTALFLNDPDKNYWLNVLGYDVGTTETGITLENLQSKQELRQVGAVMHSTPILLTQEGKITVNSAGEIDTTNRDDYLLFGSTQGLLHVVDADTGIEKFVFVPHEMMQNQKAAFLSEASTTGGAANLFYGIDAPWTAYSQYIAKADGTLTVNDSGRTVKESDDGDEIALKGLQWVYGGLRMGGRSYYALDLSDINTPSLKFHINPDAAVTATGTPDTNNALSYMGQSWSKPTIAYVKFGDTKKLVMFVGGGYDAKGATTACNASGDTVAKNIGYECAAYDQNTTTGSGAGVYMFDANTGDLLWWTSAYATAAKGAEAFTNASASTINMKYSVVSQINTIDRDNDGLADHLYFGDLRGQAFRVDLNNSATTKANFATRVVRLFDQHAAGGASPRFYEMPSISIHEDNGYVAAVAFSSGNRSSPLVGGSGTNQAGSTVSAVDGVFVVYDKDVVKSDLYDASPTLTTQNVTLASLNTNISTGVVINGNNGWKYTYSSTAGVYKGMNELYALDGMLYVNVYHRDGTGIGGNCGAGVKGDSYIYQFCLPTGKCSFSTTVSNTPNRVKIGAGILGSGIGQDLGGRNSKLVVPRPTSLDCTTTANKNKPECQQFNTAAKLQQLRWYETR